jgi:hypothetical protein
VYRTRDLARWSANPTRLANRLVERGLLQRLAHGLYLHPDQSKFGAVPPTDQALLRAFLGGGRFVLTGPAVWNTLGLGTTALHTDTLVYNTKRSGSFQFCGRTYRLRRVAFPRTPSREWFVVDLLEHADEAGGSRRDLVGAVRSALDAGRLDAERLGAMASRYGSRAVQILLEPLLGRVVR